MKNMYNSKEWKALNKIDRAQLLLVLEGLKKGTIVMGNWTSFRDILNKTGLDYKLNTNKYRLNPVFVVARPEDLRKATHQYLILPENASRADFHRITGELLGYPKCCTEEYIKERTTEQIRDERNGKFYLSYNFGKELESKIKSDGTYPEIFDYAPPSFTPCSINCPEAVKMLSSYKEAINTLDPEAAKELIYLNRNSTPERFAHKEYLKLEDSKRSLEYKLSKLREMN